MSGPVETLDPLPRARPARPLVIVAVVVLLTALVANGVVRHREADRVAACADGAGDAMARSEARLVAAIGYVRPVLDGSPPGDLREAMFRILATATRGTHRPLERAADSCASVAVLALHPGLRDRRDRCVRLLRARAAFLRAVAADGANVLDWPRLRRTC